MFMKGHKVFAVVLGVLMGVSLSSLSFAEAVKGNHSDAACKTCSAKLKDGMASGIMPIPVMNPMMGRQVVATSDGGVVIITGNAVAKYDKDMNLVKESELKMPMHTQMPVMTDSKTDATKKCPMMMKDVPKDTAKEVPVKK
jgi:hypothetical protein